jgi:pimeloyl-ACP methyl ester carboxylesterase
MAQGCRLGALLALLATLGGCKSLTSVTESSAPILGSALGLGSTSSSLSLSDPGSEAAKAYRAAARTGDDLARLDALLQAAHLSIEAASASTEETDARKIYNAACAEAAVIAHRLAGQRLASTSSNSGPFPLQGDNFERVSIVDADHRGFLRQEDILAADQVSVKRLEEEVKQDGIGGTLVAYSSKASALYSNDPNIPSEGRAIALTAVIHFPRSGEARLEIHDPGEEDDLRLSGRRRKLAANFSTPIGVIGAKTAKGNLGLKALVKPTKNEEIRGLSFLEPFERDQVPVVFVHGLMSLPRVWVDVYLELMKDERIRENCQFWYYRYPTGYGIGRNSREFRTAFGEAMKRHDPGRASRALNQAVLVGHSMGGLLSSISIRSSGNRVWNQVATRSPEQLGLDEEDVEKLRSVAFFEPLPQVSRAVFVATPHRGSEIASGLGGKIGISLIQIPGSMLGMAEAITPLQLAGLSSLGLEVLSRETTSIDHLKPDSWELQTLLELPISPRVRTHSIIGMKKEEPLEESSDGVVPYWSSHIDGVDSELIVKSDHGVPENEEAIAEIRRLLHLHLDGIGR